MARRRRTATRISCRCSGSRPARAPASWARMACTWADISSRTWRRLELGMRCPRRPGAGRTLPHAMRLSPVRHRNVMIAPPSIRPRADRATFSAMTTQVMAALPVRTAARCAAGRARGARRRRISPPSRGRSCRPRSGAPDGAWPSSWIPPRRAPRAIWPRRCSSRSRLGALLGAALARALTRRGARRMVGALGRVRGRRRPVRRRHGRRPAPAARPPAAHRLVGARLPSRRAPLAVRKGSVPWPMPPCPAATASRGTSRS